MMPAFNDWLETTLDCVGEWQGGSTPSKRNYAYWFRGTIPWISPKDFNNEDLTSSPDMISELALSDGRSRLVPPGSVLFVVRSGVLRHSLPVRVNSIPVAINQDVRALIPTTGIDPYFLYYQMRAFASELLEAAVKDGTTVESVDFESLRRFPILIAPTEVQKRVVAHLNELQGAMSRSAEQLKKTNDRIKQTQSALLRSAFSGELSKIWRTTSEVAEPWTPVTVRDVASSISYGSSAKSKRKGGTAVLRMGNIQEGRLDLRDLVFTSDPKEIERYRLQDGDVLFNRTNSPELVGKTATYRSELPAIAAGYLIVVRCTKQIVPELLTYFLNSPVGKTYWWKVKSDGVSQSNINAQKLAAFAFDLPPLSEQQEIVRKLDAMLQSLRAVDNLLSGISSKQRHLEIACMRAVFQRDRGNAAGANTSVYQMLANAQLSRNKATMKTPRGKSAIKDRVSTIDLVRAEAAGWPKNGVSFASLRETVPREYEAIKEALFALMSGPTPEIKQEFDKSQSSMRLKRVDR